MAKKSHKHELGFFINGQPASAEEIAREAGRNAWKSYLETNDLHHSESAGRYLREKLGEYLSAHAVCSIVGIERPVLERLRTRGNLSAEKLKGRWYYSVQSLNEAFRIVIRQ